MNERRASRRSILWVALAGLALGIVITALLPRDLLFVADDHAYVSTSGTTARYACPMFCVVVSEKPASGRCPVCGMELDAVGEAPRLSRHEQWMTGLAAEPLEPRHLEVVIRQIGEVDYDETRLSTVTTRVAGFLEKVHVQETWVAVEAGEKLVEIYSPELYAAQGEHLIAWERAGRPAQLADVADEDDRNFLRSTITKLANLGIHEDEIRDIRERGEPQRTIALRAPRSGIVIRRNVVEGTSLNRGQELYVVADLSSVWIQVEAFEHELPWIAVGQRVDLLSETVPDQVFQGSVAFRDPVIDRLRRTARIRVVARNPHLVAGQRLFQPGQRVDATIHARLGREARFVPPRKDGSYAEEDLAALLAIPRESVLHTGRRNVAFILFEEKPTTDDQGQPGHVREYRLDPARIPANVGYELATLRLGPLAVETGSDSPRQYYPVLCGSLQEGSLVVTAGNFLLDSQAQLAGRPSLFFPRGSRPVAPDSHTGH